MSTKTNFKRIALVAVAALGLGVLSSVPSNAAITGTLAVTAVNGTATTSVIDSTTAGTIKVRWLATSGSDTVGIKTALNSKPSTASSSISLVFFPVDTATSVVASTLQGTNLTGAPTGATNDTATIAQASGSGGYVSGTFGFQLDTTVAIKAGTYTYTLTISPVTAGVIEPTKVVTQDVSIVVSAVAAESTTASSVTSTAILSSVVSNVWQSSATDSILATAGTASSTAAAAVQVALLNANSGTTPKDSLTVTVDKGNVSISTTSTCSTSPTGKSLLYAYSAATVYVCIYPDGSTGTGTVSIKTINAGTFTKTIAWYGTDVKSIVAIQRLTVIGATESTSSTSTAIRAQAFDANTTNLASGTAVYSYSSDTSIVSNNGTACGATAYSASDAQWFTYCPLTVVSGKSGSVTITIRDAATAALSTVASNGVSVRVSTGTASTFTLTTDKASYAPGEKGFLIVTVKDAAGLVMPARSVTATLASGGISASGQLGAASDTLTATDFATARSSSGANAPSSNDPIKYYVFYAPATAGTLTFSAKGASTFSAASQTTATTATITVADSASAALAAVSALAVTVASLKTLITTLTNLVLKIQKKVKA